MSTEADRKKRYKKTLNLPKTSFPMRANLVQNEPRSMKRWKKIDIYPQLAERAKTSDNRFVFHDGPPFANGSIHVGHLMNKSLKDMVVRSRNVMGEPCSYVPGWDCHGLPIEHKVIAELVDKGKMAKIDALDDDARRMAIRRACTAYAKKYAKIQAGQHQRLLTLGDYDDPYMTMNPRYEAAVIDVFANLVEQGLVYRALKPVHWSIANQTALAEAELEYQDRVDPSVYVRFDATDRTAVAAAFDIDAASLDRDPGFLIWTTTPWTLPANRLIAVHEEHVHVLVKSGDDLLIVAKELLAKVVDKAGKEGEVLAETTGARLLGLGYRHPFLPDAYAEKGSGRIIAGEHVTLEDGTGLVHTAPGHGQEDYDVGMREGIAVYSPVRGDGSYDDSVPEWLRGLTVWDANPIITEHLRDSGHLYHHEDYPHSYPHDWRSKTPVIFRCTEQWFIGVDRPTARDDKSLRQLALDATRNDVAFYPGWGRDRLASMLESRPDWCISRQRSWGLPIPAFRRPDGSLLLTTATVRAVGEAFAKEGSDAWFLRDPADLLATWDAQADPDAPDGIDVAELEKTYDILDVWLESGSSWNAVLRGRDIGYPSELYLEGSDQHRGWFQTSMLAALGATGQAPFKAILTHGFTVDKDGRKMSKSLGNTLEVEDLLQEFGADVCRWWVSSLAFENDMKVDHSYFEIAGDSYRKVRNTLRFMISNLADFDPAEHAVDLDAVGPTTIDAWALGQGSELRAKVVDAYRRFAFRQAHNHLYDFCNDTLSSLYLDTVKDRLYCDPPTSERRRVTQTVLHHLTDLLVRLLAPIIPHTADEAYEALWGEAAEHESVHLATIPEFGHQADERWQSVLDLRDRVLKALEDAKADGIDNPLDAGIRLTDDTGDLEPFADDLPDLFGVSRVLADCESGEIEIVDLREEPRCERSWKRDGTVRVREDGGALSDRDAVAVGVGRE
ncbi:MAG: isoleucine--tRNA ligase [Acidobacteriota bacterium]